jgi:type IV pilus assembly protein PilE
MSMPFRNVDLRLCRRVRGFTLIELMIVVALMAVMVAVALPAYFGSVRKSRRADAIAVMSQVAQAQERVRSNNPNYSNDFGTSALNVRATASSGVTSLAETYYTITVPTNTATAYTVRAVALGSQAADTACAAMEMRMSVGNLTYVSSTSSATIGAATTDANRCWGR